MENGVLVWGRRLRTGLLMCLFTLGLAFGAFSSEVYAYGAAQQELDVTGGEEGQDKDWTFDNNNGGAIYIQKPGTYEISMKPSVTKTTNRIYFYEGNESDKTTLILNGVNIERNDGYDIIYDHTENKGSLELILKGDNSIATTNEDRQGICTHFSSLEISSKTGGSLFVSAKGSKNGGIYNNGNTIISGNPRIKVSGFGVGIANYDHCLKFNGGRTELIATSGALHIGDESLLKFGSDYAYKIYCGWSQEDAYEVSYSEIIRRRGQPCYYFLVTPKYDIAYELNGGNLPSGYPAAYSDFDEIKLPHPTKDGYTFTGWSGTDLSAATLDVTIPKGSTGARKYTATWQVNPEESGKTEQSEQQKPEPVRTNVTAKKIKLQKTSLKKNYYDAPFKLEIKKLDPLNADVYWRSDNTDIATVDAYGEVTLHNNKSGKVKITAYGKNDKVKSTCTITVKGPQMPKSVKIDKVTEPIEKGQTIHLTAQIKPTTGILDEFKGLKWSLAKGNKGHADIDEKTGKLTCTGAGDIKVQVETCNGKKGNIIVKGPKPVSSVNVKTESKNTKVSKLTPGDKFKLIANVKPDRAMDKTVTWKSEDDNIASVDQEGNVTCKKEGKIKIFATSNSNTNKVGKVQLTIKASKTTK